MNSQVEALLKQDPLPSVIVLAGEDYFRVAAMNALRERARRDRMTVQQFDWRKPPADHAASVFDDLRSGSLFGERKLVLIHPADKFLTKSKIALKEFLQAPGNGGSLVVSVNRAPTAKAWKAGATIMTFKKLYPNQVPAWVSEQASGLGRRLQPAAARRLLELLGDNLFKLDNALRKLADVTPAGAVIQVEQVMQHIGADREVAAFELQDALVSGNVGAVLKILSYHSDTELHAAIHTQIRTLRQWRKMWILRQDGISPEDMARRLSLHPFVVKKQLPALRGKTLPEFNRKLIACRETDQGIKTGKLPLRLAAELLAVTLCT